MDELVVGAIGALGFLLILVIIFYFVDLLLISVMVRFGLSRVAKKTDILLLDIISILLPSLLLGIYVVEEKGFLVGTVIIGLAIFDILIFGLFQLVRKVRLKNGNLKRSSDRLLEYFR